MLRGATSPGVRDVKQHVLGVGSRHRHTGAKLPVAATALAVGVGGAVVDRIFVHPRHVESEATAQESRQGDQNPEVMVYGLFHSHVSSICKGFCCCSGRHSLMRTSSMPLVLSYAKMYQSAKAA